MKTKLDKLIRFALLAPFVTAMVIYGSTKPKPGPNFSFDNTYIGDGGSYATNDTVHVELARRIMELPIDDCDVIAYMRVRSSNSAADYVMLPTYKFGEYPVDFTVQNATNYNYWFYLDYVPPSPVHTNGVFELRGFEVAGEPRVPNPIFSAGFAQSAIVDNREIVPIEYLESTGTQYIKTEILLPASFTILSTIESHNTQYGFLCGARTATQSSDRFAILANGAQMIGFDFIDNYRDRVNIRDRVVDVTAIVSNSIMRVFSAGSSTIIPEARTKPLCPCPLWLFECNTGNATTTFKGKYRLYSFSLYDNDTRRYLLDFQPVRVGRIGYLFDRVSGEYLPFGNKGTGSFILGPDIKE